jgi:hypothetical protein
MQDTSVQDIYLTSESWGRSLTIGKHHIIMPKLWLLGVLDAAEGTVMMIRFAVIFIGFRFGEM